MSITSSLCVSQIKHASRFNRADFDLFRSFQAFLLLHTRIYLKEGWKNDTWFFRSLVSQLLVLSILSIGLQSVVSAPFSKRRRNRRFDHCTYELQGSHYVLQSLVNQAYERRTLDWIDVVQRLLCFPTGCLTSLFFSWRIFQVSDSRAVWITCGLLWIPGTAAFMGAEISHLLTITSDFSYRRTVRFDLFSSLFTNGGS